MSDFRQRVIDHLKLEGVDEAELAKQLASICRGENIKRKYSINAKGERVLVSEEVTITASGAARGLMIADALLGGELGLGPKRITLKNPEEDLHKKFLPKRDLRVVANAQPIDVEVVPDNGPAHPELAQALEAMASDEVVLDEGKKAF